LLSPADLCYATVGVHPCSATSFAKHPAGPDSYLNQIASLARTSAAAGHTVAFGEIGLDYDRLHYADKETQLRYFEAQLDVATSLHLPLFLHMRAAAADFESLLKPRLAKLPKRGLVHSFTGSLEEMRSLVDLGLDIGVNGCSLKTEENLAVVKEIPLERLQIETDGPWCEIRPSHAGYKYLKGGEVEVVKAVKKEKWIEGCMIKGRNEPACIVQVAHIVAKVKGVEIKDLCEA
jgi:TatD DNase family protein